MDEDIAVLGTGAIGSNIGGFLTRAGHDVLLIDQWPAHVEAMRAHGLVITTQDEELCIPVRAAHLCEVCALRRQFDIVLLAAKSYDTCWMTELLKPYLKPDGVLVSAQNSLNDEWIAPIIGRERDIACVVELAAELSEPGNVRRHSAFGPANFVLGELDGSITPRLHRVAEILSPAGATEISANIWGAKWTKLVVNTKMALSGIIGVLSRETIEKAELFDLGVKLGREAVQVGTALGYTLEPILGLTAEDFLSSTDEVVKKALLALRRVVGNSARNAVDQDLLKGRRTEVDFLNGLVVRKGREANVPTPLNEAVTSLMKQIEEGSLQPGVSNLRFLQSLA